ncbi:MAG: hypothetical protein H2212_15075 [Ruminococcus sp.]|nr:hypothetical protein [Ruminococcus sp.]
MEENKSDEHKKEKCFVIMPISDQEGYPVGHFTKIYNQIFKPAIEDAGYEAYRVDENKISDSIIEKIFDAIQNCPMAICDLSSKNPNVLYELGLRQAYDRPVVLVQDEKTDRIFDVSGINTLTYSSIRLYENVLTARDAITEAITETKEGNQTSMVKVMKAKVADFSTVTVSEQEKTEIMLHQIMNNLQRIESVQRTSMIGQNQEFPVHIRQEYESMLKTYSVLMKEEWDDRAREQCYTMLKRTRMLIDNIDNYNDDTDFEYSPMRRRLRSLENRLEYGIRIKSKEAFKKEMNEE